MPLPERLPKRIPKSRELANRKGPFSKTERQLKYGVDQEQNVRNKVQRAETGDPYAPGLSLQDISRMWDLRRGQTLPSSRVKTLLKEGSKKFVGPRTPYSVHSENIDAIDGKYDPHRGYKKRDQRADEIEEARVFKKNPIGSVKLAVSDRIGRAKGSLLAPPGANRSTERARASELIKAARKLTDPKTRAKVLSVIQKELGSYRKRTGSRDEEIPF